MAKIGSRRTSSRTRGQSRTRSRARPKKRRNHVGALLSRVALLVILLVAAGWYFDIGFVLFSRTKIEPKDLIVSSVGSTVPRRDGTRAARFEDEIWAMARKADATEDPKQKAAILARIVYKLRRIDTVYANFNLVRAFSEQAKLVDDKTEKIRLLDLAIAFKKSPNPRVRMIVGTAMLQKAEHLPEGPHRSRLIDEVIASQRGGKDADAQLNVGVALSMKVKSVPRAERTALYDAIIDELDNNKLPFAERLLAWAMIEKADESNDAETKKELMAAVRERFATHKDEYIRKLANSAEMREIEQSGSKSEKLASFDEAIARADTAGDELRSAKLMNSKAWQTDDKRERIRLLDEVIGTFGASTNKEVRIQVFLALFSKAEITEDTVERNRIHDSILAEYAQVNEHIVQSKLFEILMARAAAMTGKDEKIREYDRIIELFGKKDMRTLASDIGEALAKKAELTGDTSEVDRYYKNLARSGNEREAAFAFRMRALDLRKPAEKMRVYDDIILLFGKSRDDHVQAIVATAMYEKAEMVEDKEEKIRLYDAIINKYANNREVVSSGRLAWAIEKKKELTGDAAQAVAQYDAIIQRAGNSATVIRAMLDKAKALADPAAKIAICDEILATYGKSRDRNVLEKVGEAMLYKASLVPGTEEKAAIIDAVFEMGSTYSYASVLFAAVSAYEKVIEDATDPEQKIRLSDRLAEHVSKGHNPDSAASILLKKTRYTDDAREKAQVCRDIIQRFRDSDDQFAAATVREARFQLVELTESVEEKIRLLDDNIASAMIATPEAGGGRSRASGLPRRRDIGALKKAFRLKERLIGDTGLTARFFDDLIAREPDAKRKTDLMLLKAKAVTGREQGIRVYDEVIAFVSASGDEALGAAAAEAMLEKARAARDRDEKIRLYDALIERYGESERRDIAVKVAYAYTEKGSYGKDPSAYKALIAKYKNHDDPVIQHLVEKAEDNLKSPSGK